MATRAHVHEEIFSAGPETVFALLHTPSAIREWWGASRAVIIPQAGGVWAAAWGEDEDDPDFITVATMQVFDPSHRIVFGDYRYESKSGPLPFDANFVTEFTVKSTPEGTLLRVCQDGFPAGSEADEFYAACEQGWRDTFQGIRDFLARL